MIRELALTHFALASQIDMPAISSAAPSPDLGVIKPGSPTAGPNSNTVGLFGQYTLTDLAEKRVDGGDLGTVVRDCIDYGTLTTDTVVNLLAPYAARWDLPAFNGKGLLELLLWSCREPIGA